MKEFLVQEVVVNIAIPLSKSIQDKIIKEADLDDNFETEKYLKQIEQFLQNKNIQYYKTDLGIEYHIKFVSVLTSDEISMFSNFIKNLDLDKTDFEITKYDFILKHKPTIAVINGTAKYESEKLKQVLHDTENEILIVINEVIESKYANIFYPCRKINFAAWGEDNKEITAIFKPKAKSKGDTNKYIQELSDTLENEF